jgi:serpin B
MRVLLILLFFSPLLLSCNDEPPKGTPPEQIKRTSSPIKKKVVPLKFSKDLYKFPFKFEKTLSARHLFKLIAPKDTNFVFSPLSLEAALHLLMLTAKGNSLKKLAHFLNIKNTEALNELMRMQMSFQLISKKPNDPTEEGQLPIIDFGLGIVNHRKLNLKAEKVTEIKSLLDTYWAQYDFSKENKKALREINQWVETKTKNKIKELIPRIPNDTLLILLNTLYLKVSWEEGFKKDFTKKRPFKLKSGEKVLVDMMQRQSRLQTVVKDSFKAVKIDMDSIDLD